MKKLFILPRKNRRGTRAGGEGVFLAHFQKLEKMCPNLGKNGLIVVIYGKHFLFKTQLFKSFHGKKARDVFHVGLFFLVVAECLLKYSNSKEIPLPSMTF